MKKPKLKVEDTSDIGFQKIPNDSICGLCNKRKDKHFKGAYCKNFGDFFTYNPDIEIVDLV